jgi:indolepyruvate decarboxylase
MPSVSEFLLERIENVGVKHVFGVPGDYVLKFYKKISDYEGIELVNTTDENHAGFAADAYARVHGIGCVCVTYNVGALKITNSVACAYAERSPLIVISGSPGMNEREEGMLLHHMVRSFECQKEIFDNLTCASTVLDNPNCAGYEIDRVLEALQHHKQPIYIELPRDIADRPIAYDVYKQGTPKAPVSDKENLVEAIEEVTEWISFAKNPVILAGVQVARFGLGSEIVKFAEKTNIPICATILGKSVVGEYHPLFRGIYMGTSSTDGVQELIEESDCLLMFGVLLTDLTLSFMPSRFSKRQTMSSSVEGLKVKNHSYPEVLFKDFCDALFKSQINRNPFPSKANIYEKAKFVPDRNKKITTARLFEKINSIIVDEDMAIVADIGDCLFGAADLVVHHRNQFLSPAFYTSMGSAIPGALGVQLARPDIRPIVLVGDGAFQMSCNELSTIVARKLNPIVFVLNNHGYTTERIILSGSFNNIADWEYHRITEMIGGGIGAVVETEGDLEEVISAAILSDEAFIIQVVVDFDDISPALKRMTKGLSIRV